MKVSIFTDGACSKNPGSGGWSSIFVSNKNTILTKKSGGEKYTTNNKMELKAVVESLKVIKSVEDNRETKGLSHNDYLIFSDSAYVVNAKEKNWLLVWVNNGWKNAKGDDVKNKELWKEFLELFTYLVRHHVNVELRKVKGHDGVKFNEEADFLARKESKKFVL